MSTLVEKFIEGGERVSEPTIILIIYGVVASVILIVGHGVRKESDDQTEDIIGIVCTAIMWPILLVFVSAFGVGFVFLYWLPRKIGVAIFSRVHHKRIAKHVPSRPKQIDETPAHIPVMPDWR